ncbi:restriction endonuclease subunit S [Novosphingobium sp.]|jgi:type I restriction enzyme S subunit|uniref:restriction endonuclease subunit S n=1 Tax=Novosphingobium sp. TaxID=1874826 RepID=UPI002FE1E112
MNAEQLLAHYERISEAPDAIARLRRFVLDLAVRGKLVEQVPADEPASELLGRIASAKAQLVKTGALRKPRDLSDSPSCEQLYEIPTSWSWCRLDSVGAIVGGGTPSAGNDDNFAEPGNGIPWLTPADLGKFSGLYIERGARDLSAHGLQSSSATLMPAGSVLFTSRAPIGYVAIAANPISTNQGFKSIVPYVPECSRFIATAMQAFAPEIDANAPGTTFKEVSGKIVAGVSFPLPPLAEQRRIVAKVDELMALCDRLEEARKEREAARDRLTAASLARLNAPDPDPATFTTHARFALNNLTKLSSQHRQIAQWRATIIELATRGKLSLDDANDTPPAKALEAINDARDALVHAKLLRREKPQAAVRTEEIPFQAPVSWLWTRLGEVALFTQYGTSLKAEQSTTGVPVLTMGNIQSGTVVSAKEKRIPSQSSELPELYLRKFDLLYNRTNSPELVGKTGIYLGNDDCVTFASYLIRLRFVAGHTDPHFINLAMNAPGFRSSQISPYIKQQTGQANVNGTAMKNMLIALPPIEEQRRIVAKVDELMALCGRLETCLATGDETRQRLLEAVLHEALEPAEVRELELA